MHNKDMEFATRSLSSQESRVVLSLAEHGHKEVGRQEVISILGGSPQAADHVIRSLRRKGWLERASWGRYLMIPPDMGPYALGEGNVLALASRIAVPYYFGYGTAATHYGLTTQHRHVIWLVTPVRARHRRLLDTEIRIVNPVQRKFFGVRPDRCARLSGHDVRSRKDGDRLHRPPAPGWRRGRSCHNTGDDVPPASTGTRLQEIWSGSDQKRLCDGSAG